MGSAGDQAAHVSRSLQKKEKEMKTLLDAFNYAMRKAVVSMGPECCGKEMVEIESGFTNELNEYEIVGYECPTCGYKTDLTGKEID